MSQPGYLFSNAQCVFAQIWDLQTIINTQESIQIILWPIPLSEFLTSYQLAVKFHLLTENACFVAPNKCYKPLPLHRHMKSIWLQQLVHHHKFTSRQRFEAIFWVFIWGDQVGVRIKERQSEQSKFSWYIAHGASMKSRVAMFKFLGSLGSLDCCNLITRECRPACVAVHVAIAHTNKDELRRRKGRAPWLCQLSMIIDYSTNHLLASVMICIPANKRNIPRTRSLAHHSAWRSSFLLIRWNKVSSFLPWWSVIHFQQRANFICFKFYSKSLSKFCRHVFLLRQGKIRKIKCSISNRNIVWCCVL